MKDKKVIYVPPSTEKIDEFAKKVCESTGDTNPEVVRGFAGFIKSVAKSVAHSLNENDRNQSNG